MKINVILFFICTTFFSCGILKTSNTGILNGTWIPIYQEMNGTEMPNSFYKTQLLKIDNNNFIAMAESVDKGTLKITDNTMDIYSNEGVNKGKHFTAIYKIENYELTICYNLNGDAFPKNYETKNHKLFFKSVYKKQFH